MPPFVSIAIPAWQGKDYISYAVRSVLMQPILNLELVVSVHASEFETIAQCRQFRDPRLRVVHPPNTMSMAEHYEWCLSQLKGDWITILGQDDGLMPHFSESLTRLLRDFPDSEAFSFRRAYFFWPGCEAVYGDRGCQVRFGKSTRLITGSKAIQDCIRGTREHYEFPQIYTNGLVKRSVIEAVRDASGGRFYHEMTPDVYSGFAVALHLGCFREVDYPVFWTGTSPGSTGFSLSLTGNSNETPLSRTLVEHHIRAATQAGLGTSKVIGPKLWLQASSSAIFAVSTLDCTPLTKAKPVPNSTFETAIAALAAQLMLSFFPGFPSRANRLVVWNEAVIRAKNNGLSLVGIGTKIPGLIVRQVLARLVFLFADRKPFANKAFVSRRSTLLNLDEASEWLVREMQQLDLRDSY